MRKITMIATLVLGFTAAAYTQDRTFRPPVMSSVPNTTRYEVIQAGFLSGHITLRLDKFTGRVFYMTLCPQRNVLGTGLCWKETVVLELTKPVNDSAVRYQIVALGEENRNILLINNFTGQAWQLGIEDGLHKWTPFLDPVTLPQSFELVR